MSTEDAVLVGRIVRPHGLGGAVVVEMVTDRPEIRFRPGSVLQTSGGVTLTVAHFEPTDRSPLITFEEMRGRDLVEDLRGADLFIPAGDLRPLEPDEYWPEDLVGMEAFTGSGTSFGVVVEVEFGVGQNRLVVDTGDGTVLVPFVAEFVPEVNREANRLVIETPAGLTEGE